MHHTYSPTVGPHYELVCKATMLWDNATNNTNNATPVAVCSSNSTDDDDSKHWLDTEEGLIVQVKDQTIHMTPKMPCVGR